MENLKTKLGKTRRGNSKTSKVWK